MARVTLSSGDQAAEVARDMDYRLSKSQTVKG